MPVPVTESVVSLVSLIDQAIVALAPPVPVIVTAARLVELIGSNRVIDGAVEQPHLWSLRLSPEEQGCQLYLKHYKWQ